MKISFILIIIIDLICVQVAGCGLPPVGPGLPHILIDHRIQIEQFEDLLFLGDFHWAVFYTYYYNILFISVI